METLNDIKVVFSHAIHTFFTLLLNIKARQMTPDGVGDLCNMWLVR